ncbi:hypothetical protein VTJ83DRAFT_362 [Remersonia thermophila]|uniref:Chromo domain-containing protein n=1 Tax=Remersonia thermophila TaxID=72144 RepID=A0ABR4DKS4_9PEZI
MPFAEDFLAEGDLPLIQSDLLYSVEEDHGDDDYQIAEDQQGLSVVVLGDQIQSDIPEADMDLQAEIEADIKSAEAAAAAAAATPTATASSAKKRGRPSLGNASEARAKTPASAKSIGRGSARRKSLAAEGEEDKEAGDTPVRKRGRPARSAAIVTGERIAASENKTRRRRGAAAVPAKTPGRRGRSPKSEEAESEEETPEGEYEVEAIVDSAIDADTMKHMYLVKWKNYPESDNTWEPKENLTGALELVRKFDIEKKKAEDAEAAKKAREAKEAKEAAAKRVSVRKAAAASTTTNGNGEPKKRGRKPGAAKVVKPVKSPRKTVARIGCRRPGRA